MTRAPWDAGMTIAALVLAVALGLAACGVALSGRVEIGSEVGEPEAASPCP